MTVIVRRTPASGKPMATMLTHRILEISQTCPYGLTAKELAERLGVLSEMTTLYANLARTVMRQRGDREARQIAMDGMAASIAHEVNQPLSSIALNGQAALRFLAQAPPNIDQVRAALGEMVSDSGRGSQVIASLRTMFKKGNHGRVSLNVNDLVQEVIAMVDIELRSQQVSLSTDLRPGLP